MDAYYPIMLKLSGKKAVVIGGGQVATRKIRTLLRAQANVLVVSPTVTQVIKEWVRLNQVHWISRDFEQKDLEGAYLIIAATNQAKVNKAVYDTALSEQLVNIVDRPDLSDFIVPSSIQRGKLMITVSTSGASPGLSRKIRQELAEQFDASYEEYILFLAECRQRVLASGVEPNKKNQILKELLHPSFLEFTRLGLLNEREVSFQKLLDGINK